MSGRCQNKGDEQGKDCWIHPGRKHCWSVNGRQEHAVLIWGPLRVSLWCSLVVKSTLKLCLCIFITLLQGVLWIRFRGLGGGMSILILLGWLLELFLFLGAAALAASSLHGSTTAWLLLGEEENFPFSWGCSSFLPLWGKISSSWEDFYQLFLQDHN